MIFLPFKLISSVKFYRTVTQSSNEPELFEHPHCPCNWITIICYPLTTCPCLNREHVQLREETWHSSPYKCHIRYSLGTVTTSVWGVPGNCIKCFIVFIHLVRALGACNLNGQFRQKSHKKGLNKPNDIYKMLYFRIKQGKRIQTDQASLTKLSMIIQSRNQTKTDVRKLCVQNQRIQATKVKRRPSWKYPGMIYTGDVTRGH